MLCKEDDIRNFVWKYVENEEDYEHKGFSLVVQIEENNSHCKGSKKNVDSKIREDFYCRD